MPSRTPTVPGEIARRGREIYDREIRQKVEDGNQGKFVVIDILTHDFEVADDDPMASERILQRNPDALLYGIRIGSPAAYRIGFRGQSPA